MAQSFESVPGHHALAVAFGLIPALAGWALLLINTVLAAVDRSLFDTAQDLIPDLYVHGAIALEKGFLLTSMLWAAILVFCIERRFLAAAGWTVAASLLAVTGIVHGYELTRIGAINRFLIDPETLSLQVGAPAFAAMYALAALFLLGLHVFARRE